uniref:Ubiquitin conjugating enzyme E2 U n=1 Tax=Podarcis muralis TaxID=64176 RepID=A0A670IYR7_PODMU
MEWVAEIEGLKDTLWEGAELQLSLRYTEEYNRVPPSVTFNTIPFHPNVDPKTGRPCLDFLDDPTKWDTKLTMTGILLCIQVLLSIPVLKNPVNLEAANLLKNNYPLYRKKVIQCVRTSQHLDGNKPPCFMLLVINIFFEPRSLDLQEQPFSTLGPQMLLDYNQGFFSAGTHWNSVLVPFLWVPAPPVILRERGRPSW